MRRAAKVDGNHAEIVKALRKVGCSVVSLARVGYGCPDLLASLPGRTVLLEVKQPGGKLNADQKEFHAAWRGPIATVWNVEDAVRVMTAYAP